MRLVCFTAAAPLMRAGLRSISPSSVAVFSTACNTPYAWALRVRCSVPRPVNHTRTSSGVISASARSPSAGRMFRSRWYS